MIDADLDGLKTRIVGFENHGGQTLNVTHPLGKVVKGYGNSFGAGFEGFYDGIILGTYLHGPLLPKNPEVADFVISKAIQKRNPDFKYSDLKPLEDKFEMLWLEKRKAILMNNEEYRKATEGYKMSSGADWLLFGMPIVAAIVVLDQSFFANEMLNWLLGAGVAAVLFVIAVAVKAYIIGVRPVSEIEDEIKQRCKEQFEATGKF